MDTPFTDRELLTIANALEFYSDSWAQDMLRPSNEAHKQHCRLMVDTATTLCKKVYSQVDGVRV